MANRVACKPLLILSNKTEMRNLRNKNDTYMDVCRDLNNTFDLQDFLADSCRLHWTYKGIQPKVHRVYILCTVDSVVYPICACVWYLSPCITMNDYVQLLLYSGCAMLWKRNLAIVKTETLRKQQNCCWKLLPIIGLLLHQELSLNLVLRRLKNKKLSLKGLNEEWEMKKTVTGRITNN